MAQFIKALAMQTSKHVHARTRSHTDTQKNPPAMAVSSGYGFPEQ